MNVRQLGVVAGREFRSLLVSPVAHVAGALFLAVTGLYFTAEVSGLTEARLDGWFESSAILLLFLAPALTMRSLAEEQRSGSLDIVRAGPVGDATLVVGKFVGIAGVWALVLLATLPGPVLVESWSDLDRGATLTGYLGLFLLGLASIAVALFASALTRHQAVAAVVGFVLLLVLWLLQGLGDVFAGTASDVLIRLGTTTRLVAFNRGLLRVDAVVYYASVVGVGLIATVRAVEARSLR